MASFLLARIWNISSASFVYAQTALLQQGMNFIPILFQSLTALIFLALGLAVMAAYGYREDKRMIIPPAVGAIAALILFNFTPASFFIAIGIIISSIYVVPLANTYGKELKRWIPFRVGTNAVGKSLMIFNIMLALGVGLTIYSDMDGYQDIFKEGLESIIIGSVPPEIAGNIDASQLADTAVSSSPLLQKYLSYLPILITFGAWVLLEFLRTIVLSNVAGAATAVLIRKDQ